MDNSVGILSLLLNPFWIIKALIITGCVMHILYMLFVLMQVRSMERVITQPLASAVLGFIVFALLGASVVVMIYTIRLM